MEMKHLTDETVQEYLDGVMDSENIQATEKHLLSCFECGRLLREYKSVYNTLANQSAELLTSDFSSKVIARLPAVSPVRKYQKLWNVFLISLFLILSLGLTQFYTDLRPVGKETFNSIIPQIKLSTSDSFTAFLPHLSLEKYRLFFYTAVTLLLVFLVDKGIRRIRVFGSQFHSILVF